MIYHLLIGHPKPGQSFSTVLVSEDALKESKPRDFFHAYNFQKIEDSGTFEIEALTGDESQLGDSYTED